MKPLHYTTLQELRELVDEAEALEQRLERRMLGVYGGSPEGARLELVLARACERTNRRLRKLYPPRPMPVDMRTTEERSF